MGSPARVSAASAPSLRSAVDRPLLYSTALFARARFCDRRFGWAGRLGDCGPIYCACSAPPFACARLAIVVAVVVAVLLPSALPVQAATPAFRQARGAEIGSGTVASVGLTSANVAGNLIVVQVIWSNSGAVTLSDTRGNTYVAATPRTTWSSGWSAQAFYTKDIAAGANSVSATFSTPINSFGIVQVHEYSGIDEANPFDGATIRTGTGTTMNSGVVTTTNANELLWGPVRRWAT